MAAWATLTLCMASLFLLYREGIGWHVFIPAKSGVFAQGYDPTSGSEDADDFSELITSYQVSISLILKRLKGQINWVIIESFADVFK